MIFDTHCHLDRGDASDVAARATAVGVTRLLTVGIDAATSRTARAISVEFATVPDAPTVLYSAGLHPNRADRFESEWDDLVELCRESDCTAIGETGLDYYRDHTTPAQQKEALTAHLDLARAIDKPVIIHSRDALADTFDVLADHRSVRGVIHCFSGGVEEARRALDLGYYLSFAGPLTYPRADDLRTAAAFAPADRILVETDAPFLTPQPRRGQPNEPAFVVHTLGVLAKVRGIAPDAAATLTMANGRALFG